MADYDKFVHADLEEWSIFCEDSDFANPKPEWPDLIPVAESGSTEEVFELVGNLDDLLTQDKDGFIQVSIEPTSLHDFTTQMFENLASHFKPIGDLDVRCSGETLQMAKWGVLVSIGEDQWKHATFLKFLSLCIAFNKKNQMT